MELTWIVIAALAGLCVILALRVRALNAQMLAAGMVEREMRVAQAQLRRQAAHALASRDAITNTTIDPILFVDAGHIVTYHNNAAQRLFGGACAPGRSLIEVTRCYELDVIVDEVLKDAYELPRELRLGGRQFRVRAGAFRSENGGGQLSREAVLLLYDVGELQRLGRARRDFVANISHELRTPLATIRLLVDTLRQMPPQADETQHGRLLNQISDQLDSLTQLAQEMYDLSLIESGRVPMRMVPTDMAELVDSVILRLAPQAERAGLTLTSHVQRGVVGLVDPDQIRRVLSNLLHNAIKFTPRGSVTVWLSDATPPQPTQPNGELDDAASEADHITLAVQDTGVGIPADALPRIFERFYKVDRVRGQGGTGLGLSIAKHIVEAHGGRLWVESREGVGTTFYFTVPHER